MNQKTFAAPNLVDLQRQIDDHIDDLLDAGLLVWTCEFTRIVHVVEGRNVSSYECVVKWQQQ